MRHTYRPFDNRWLYWEADSTLLDRPRPQYKPHIFAGNLWLSAAQHLRRDANEPQACFTKIMGSGHLIERGASMFPAYLREEGDLGNGGQAGHRPNLAPAAHRYLKHLSATVEDLFYHVLATLHDPAYRQANAGALKMEWPRIPLPGWPNGEADGAADSLTASAARGRELARLLDPDAPVPGITQGTLRPAIAALAVPATTDGRNMTGDDFALTVGWGHYGTGDAVMPGQGRIVEREYTDDELAAMGDAISVLGEKTLDVYLNDRAYWRNVPAAIWDYKLGGYQVLKKWLSYREHDVLGRVLTPEEVLYFAEMTRRVGALLVLSCSKPPNQNDHLTDKASKMNPTAYIETSVISYLTSRPSRDVVITAYQQVTREWWNNARDRFDLVASELVVAEVSVGDEDAAVTVWRRSKPSRSLMRLGMRRNSHKNCSIRGRCPTRLRKMLLILPSPLRTESIIL